MLADTCTRPRNHACKKSSRRSASATNASLVIVRRTSVGCGSPSTSITSCTPCSSSRPAKVTSRSARWQATERVGTCLARSTGSTAARASTRPSTAFLHSSTLAMPSPSRTAGVAARQPRNASAWLAVRYRLRREGASMVRDAVRGYLALAGGLTEVTAARARAAARSLVEQGEATASQVTALAEDLVATSRRNRESLVLVIRHEAEQAVRHL